MWAGALSWSVVFTVAVNVTMLAPATPSAMAARGKVWTAASATLESAITNAPPNNNFGCGPRWLSDATETAPTIAPAP